jgi:uncharacterized radical SAM superfamily Fe-S cluster-containing enzyme
MNGYVCAQFMGDVMPGMDHLVWDLAAALDFPIVTSWCPRPDEWTRQTRKRGVELRSCLDARLNQEEIDLLVCYCGKFDWQKSLIDRAKRIVWFDTAALKDSLLFDVGMLADSPFRSTLRAILPHVEPDSPWIELYRRNNCSKYDQGGTDGLSHLSSDFVFVPLQNGDDIQIIRHSPVTVAGFVRQVAAACRSLGLAVVFKRHPRDHTAAYTQRALDEIVDNKWVFQSQGSVHSLIERCRFLMLINSSTAVDASFHPKPVVQVGESQYDSCGMTIHDENVYRALKKGLDLTGEQKAAMAEPQQRYVTWLREYYLVFYGGSREESRARAEGLAQRVLRLAEGDLSDAMPPQIRANAAEVNGKTTVRVTTAAESVPLQTDYTVTHARQLEQQGNSQEAVSLLLAEAEGRLNRALLLEPDNAQMMCKLAYVWVRMGQYDRALQLIAKLRMNGSDPALEQLNQEARGRLLEMKLYPRFISIEIASVCNARCHFCQAKYVKREPLMKEPVWRKIIEDNRTSGVEFRLNMAGEPLCNPDLPRIIRCIKEKSNCKVTFNTNGALLKAEVAKAILESGVDGIRFSVDGFRKETYERHRIGVCYNVVVSNILLFLQLRERMKHSSFVEIRMIRFPSNESERAGFQAFWGSFPRVSVVFTTPYYWPQSGPEGVQKPCGRGRDDFELYYFSDGRATLCCMDWKEQGVLGHCMQSSTREIWNSEKAVRWRALLRDGRRNEIPLCSGCALDESIDADIDAERIERVSTSRSSVALSVAS